MDIFEQLENAQAMLVNDVITTNFGWNADDEYDEWCLSIYGYEADCRNFEYYFGRDQMINAERRDTSVWLLKNDHDDGFTKIEFCALVPIAEYTNMYNQVMNGIVNP